MPVNTVQFQSSIKFISRDRAGSKPMVIPCVSLCRAMWLVLYDQAESRASNFATEKRTRAGERRREGTVFNPYPVPTPCSILFWPFNFLRPLNLLFFPSLSLPTRGTEKFDSGHRTSVSISGSCQPTCRSAIHARF